MSSASSPPPAIRKNAIFRFAQLQLGLFGMALGIALMLGARLGLDPWSAFHEGLVIQTDWSFGRITQAVGLGLIAVSWVLFRERPGIGTVCNMLVIGPWIDLICGLSFYPQANDMVFGTIEFLAGIAICALASGLYIGARFGAGPRDAFVLGLARRTGRSIRFTRVALELVVLGTGWSLGAPIGLGTLLFAFLMGPAMQASLRLFGYTHRRPPTEDSAPARS
ncbi:MAG: hypothetical protein B7733_02825 [Myxococcales bacterium FL481]|nr:MAG: hypothetical protein B7733_02825 [Myxococcales bacterium FL481]